MMSILPRRICLLSFKLSKFNYLWPLIVNKHCMSYLGKWEIPQGYDTGIIIHNSATGKKVPLVLKKKDITTWYMCGPTVYAESHIGHASCYVKFDIIRRILENVFNINVLLLLGITDIDDKIIKKSSEAGVDAFQLAKKFELDFFEDMETMKVLPPTIISRVSDNIPLIISFCENLIKKDYAYATSEGNVYFVVSKGTTADVLHDIPDSILQDVQRDPLKRDPRDFALWKSAKPNEPYWDSPWGPGRPGWHIECSAMASKIFGSEIDLHSGGADLLFPHHSNEKSQSEAYHNCSQWVNYWLHAGLLQVDDEFKMSKSLGNTISIKDFLKEHYVNDFRILCLQSRYRKNLPYNSETLFGAKSLHKKLHNFINECEAYISGEVKGSVEEEKLLEKLTYTKGEVINFLQNDFNTTKALLSLTNFVDEVNKSLATLNTSDSSIPSSISTVASCYMYVNKILEIFGIHIITKKKLPKEIVFSIDSVVKFRDKIREIALNPKIIDAKKIENAYKAMQTELKMIYKSEMPPKLILELLDSSKMVYEKAFLFSETMDSNKIIESLDQMKSKEIRKKMAPLFTICDEFRSILNEKAIGIKDRDNNSSWIPLIELQREIL